MGVFSYTFVYKGEIVKKGEKPVKYFTKVESSLEEHTLYCDGYAVLDTMYPMISDDDLKRGYVDLKKILNLIKDSPELRKEWGSIENKSDIYICECIWFSMDLAKDKMPLSIQCILPCKDAKDIEDEDYYINLHKRNLALAK